MFDPPPCVVIVPPLPELQRQTLGWLIRPQECAFAMASPFRSGAVEPVAAWLATALVRGWLRYAPDPPGQDVWRSPAVTLAGGLGDCEDFAILTASMLRANQIVTGVRIGYHLSDTGRDAHAWVEGIDYHGRFLLEATTGEVYRPRSPRYWPTVTSDEVG